MVWRELLHLCTEGERMRLPACMLSSLTAILTCLFFWDLIKIIIIIFFMFECMSVWACEWVCVITKTVGKCVLGMYVSLLDRYVSWTQLGVTALIPVRVPAGSSQQRSSSQCPLTLSAPACLSPSGFVCCCCRCCSCHQPWLSELDKPSSTHCSPV